MATDNSEKHDVISINITELLSPEPSSAPLELTTSLKKRRKRTSISSGQLKKLELLFKEEPWPSRESKESLAEEIGMSPQFVNIWFQNKRARIKKESQDEEIDPSSTPTKSPKMIKSHFLEKKIKMTREILTQNQIGTNSPNKLPPRNFPERTNNTSTFSNRCFPASGSSNLLNSKLNPPDVMNEFDSQEVPSTVTLFQCITDMMAVEEGILRSSNQPRFNDAVNDALYGIYLKDKTILTYSSSKGLEFI